MCIIVIKKKSLTIQTAHSDERPRRSTGYSHMLDLPSIQIQILILHKWYTTELSLHAPTLSSEKSVSGYERLFYQPYYWSLETTCLELRFGSTSCSLWRWSRILAWTRIKLVSHVTGCPSSSWGVPCPACRSVCAPVVDDNLSTLGWHGPFGCRLLPWWSGD